MRAPSTTAMATLSSRIALPNSMRRSTRLTRFKTPVTRTVTVTASSESDTPQVVILGGGIQGTATAFYLSQRGVPSTIVERCSIAAAASGKAGGFLAGGWGDGSVTEQLHRVSFALHEKLAEQLQLKTYRKIPTLSVAGGSALSDQKPPVSWLDGNVSRADLMDEGTAQVTPKELVNRMHEECGKVDGARTVFAEVVDVVLSDEEDEFGERQVIGVDIKHESDDKIEHIPATHVVCAMGPWSVRAESWFPGLKVPMTGIKSVSLLFKANEQVANEPAALFCAEDENSCHLEVYPRSTGEVYICGCGGSEYIDESRLKPGGDLDRADQVPTDESRVKAASASFLGLSKSVGKGGPEKTQTCMRPCAPDALPIMGQVPGYKGAYMQCAHNCWGILWAPVSGKAMGELILDGESKTVKLDVFSPKRFMSKKAGTRGRKMRERDVGEQW